VFVVARPLVASAKPLQLSATWPLPPLAATVPFVGGVWSSTIESEAVGDTLPAAFLYHAYSVFVPFPALSV
jgi:hypothetical protein